MTKSISKLVILGLLATIMTFGGCRVITDTADVVARVIGIDNGVIFYGYDSLIVPENSAELVVRLQTKYLFDVENVAIGFYHGQEQLGIVMTDDDGIGQMVWTPPGPGDYLLEAKIVAIPEDVATRTLDVAPIPLLIAVRPAETTFVVIDLDRTLVGSSFTTVLTGEATPMAESQRVVHRLARDYSIIYLTHRPSLLTYASKAWLEEHNYPPAPLLVSELSQTIRSSGAFKTATLAELRETFGQINIGVGDKLSDAQAYVDNDLTAYLIPFYDPNDTDDLEDMAEDLAELEGRGRLNVVSGWQEVEAGIYGQKQFPPETFIQNLNMRRQYLEQQ